jgi:hypothetical protein
LEEGQRCYAFDNSGLVKVDAIFDPHRPYQDSGNPRSLASLAQLHDFRTILVHTGGMNKTVRQSVSLPVNVAAQVRSMAKSRRLSSNRMLVELIENGIEAEKRRQQEFFELAERFRSATDPEEAKRLGDELGRMVFSG